MKRERERERLTTDDLFGGGVDDRDAFLKSRLPPLAVDEELSTRYLDHRHYQFVFL